MIEQDDIGVIRDALSDITSKKIKYQHTSMSIVIHKFLGST